MQPRSHRGGALCWLDANPRYLSKGNWRHHKMSCTRPVPVIGMHVEVCANQTELSSTPPGAGLNTYDDMRQTSPYKQSRFVQEAML